MLPGPDAREGQNRTNGVRKQRRLYPVTGGPGLAPPSAAFGSLLRPGTEVTAPIGSTDDLPTRAAATAVHLHVTACTLLHAAQQLMTGAHEDSVELLR